MFIFLAVWHPAWDYFEAGHDKGQCDGVGSTAKRNAATAVTQDKTNIQDACEFFVWANASESKVAYRIYDSKEYESTERYTSEQFLIPIKGTLHLHDVKGKEDGSGLYVRNTSCNCKSCLDLGNARCQDLEFVQSNQEPHILPKLPSVNVTGPRQNQEPPRLPILPSVNDFVATTLIIMKIYKFGIWDRYWK